MLCVHAVHVVSSTAYSSFSDKCTLTVVQVYCRHNSSSPPVQGGDGEWSVERVLKRDTLSNNTVYQDMLREGRRKGLPVADVTGRRIVEEEQEIRQPKEQVSVRYW